MKDLKELQLPIDIICGNDEEVNRVVEIVENEFPLWHDYREDTINNCLIVRIFSDSSYSVCSVSPISSIPNQTPASQFLTDYEAV